MVIANELRIKRQRCYFEKAWDEENLILISGFLIQDSLTLSEEGNFNLNIIDFFV